MYEEKGKSYYKNVLRKAIHCNFLNLLFLPHAVYVFSTIIFLQLSNEGPSAVKTSVIKIEWPGQDENGLNLLVLEDMPKVSRPDITCKLMNESVS